MCTGSAHLVAAERAELLTILAEESDEVIHERAGQALASQPLDGFVDALKGDAPAAHLFRYCGRHLIDKPEVATALIKNRRYPQEYMVRAAKAVSTSTVQELMDDLERLSGSLPLVAALVHSASLTEDQRQQLGELLRENTESQAAFAEAALLAEADPGKRVSLLQRLSKMRVVERVSMALKGNREERIALIHDPCKVVQRAVLQSQRITEREVESFASMTNISEDALRLISANRKFRKNYVVVRNLITNPKTPIDVSLHLLPSITAQDLKTLTTNKNIPDALRSSALRLHRQRNPPRNEE